MSRDSPKVLARKRAYMREWRSKNRERLLAKERANWRTGSKRNSRLKRLYGITLADYNALAEKQRGHCALCDKHVGDALCVDHCHTTGRVRGLLCLMCNSLLGWFENNQDKVRQYLQENNK